MKKFLFVLFLVALPIIGLKAENGGMISTSQTGGRYEIIQSNISRKMFFKLDKYTGEVFQYVKTDSQVSPYTWQKIDVLGKFEEDKPDIINYQLFIGGIAVADCILLNINTGMTYKLYEDTDTKEMFFSRFY